VQGRGDGRPFNRHVAERPRASNADWSTLGPQDHPRYAPEPDLRRGCGVTSRQKSSDHLRRYRCGLIRTIPIPVRINKGRARAELVKVLDHLPGGPVSTPDTG
jgi:hypothetical protein